MSYGKDSILTIEVGGTNTQAAVVDSSIQVVGDVYALPSQEHASEDEHISRFANLIKRGTKTAAQADHRVIAACLAFPGRCDYEAGVPLLKHKYATLYRKPFAHLLEAATGIRIFMLNDAGAFATGAAHTDQELIAKIEQLRPEARWFTAHSLGTGLGSKVVDLRNGVTVNEFEIFDTPYEDTILEDYVSARGIVRAYHETTASKEQVDPEEIARRAMNNEAAAIATYKKFGQHMGIGLPIAYQGLRPKIIALGGKISRSLKLFEQPAITTYRQANHDENAALHYVKDERVALYGAAIHAFGQLAVLQTT